MPELPEVESFKRTLEPKLIGKTITKVEIFYPRLLITPIEDISSIEGETFIKMGRKGKHLIFFLTHEKVLVAHLRMEGKYFVKEEEAPVEKADEAIFHLDNGEKLVYNDTRKFGVLGLYSLDSYLLISPLANVASSPLEMEGDELYQAIHSSKKTIKETLLEQNRVSGLGNIYVDETLFKSGINPRRIANSITEKEAATLLENARSTLEEAIEQGGSTIHSFHVEEGKSGSMQSHLLCYGKSPSPCPKCGFPFMKIAIGGRGTTYCPICQKDKDRPFVIGVTGPIHSGKSTVSQHLIETKHYPFFDCDAEVAKLYDNKDFASRFVEAFPEAKLEKNGKICKLEVWKIIDKEKDKAQSFVFSEIYKICEEWNKSQKGTILIEAPLLYQAGMDDLCDATILVVADELIRRKRLYDEGKDVDRLMDLNKGYPVGLLKRKASFVIHNNGNKADLYQEIDSLPLP